MNSNLSSFCPKPDACQIAGCQDHCRKPRPAAVAIAARAAAGLLGRDVAWHRHSDVPFKTREPLAQRKLLVAHP